MAEIFDSLTVADVETLADLATNHTTYEWYPSHDMPALAVQSVVDAPGSERVELCFIDETKRVDGGLGRFSRREYWKNFNLRGTYMSGATINVLVNGIPVSNISEWGKDMNRKTIYRPNARIRRMCDKAYAACEANSQEETECECDPRLRRIMSILAQYK